MIAEKAWLAVVGCENGHSVTWRGAELVQRFPVDATIGDVADRLRCTVCGSRDGLIGFLQDNSPGAVTHIREADARLPGGYEWGRSDE